MTNDEAIGIDDQGVAKDGRVSQLLEHGHGILLKRVSEQQDAGHQRLQPLQEFTCALQRLEILNDLQHVFEFDVVLSQKITSILHELVVVGLVCCGPLQPLNARLLLQRQPCLGHESAFDVKCAHDRVSLRDLHVLIWENVLGLQIAQHNARLDVRVVTALVFWECPPVSATQIEELSFLVVPIIPNEHTFAALVAAAEVLLQLEEVLLLLLPQVARLADIHVDLALCLRELPEVLGAQVKVCPWLVEPVLSTEQAGSALITATEIRDIVHGSGN
mmetsp:Transcript_22675/g.36449  ORF Transcript_22675/g.36449 Transcript_22675/m.36449 type:complete len:275 (+) Transcript_22675:1094-1918(+)